MTSPFVEYEYADGSTNSLRPTRVRYPDGRTLDYSYGASGSDDDRLSRVSQLKEGSTVLEQYEYLGARGFARCDLPQPQVRWNLSPSGDSFSGLDALDRTVDCLWQKYAPSAGTPVQIGYTYDRASNRTSRDVAGATGNDERYRYDRLNRLTDLDRGDLSAAKITSPQAAEQWRLDATGNWGRYENLDFAAPGNSLDQDRTANRANEITGFTSTVGASWSQPIYDRAGNMTQMPQPKTPTNAFGATYDAWNRLLGLSDGSTYAYDALNRRTVQAAAGVTRHYYYSNAWQVLEERLGTTPDSASAERQFVWGPRYIDDLVLRDRSPTNNGTLSERLYALQDANWNVVAVVDTTGAVQERYRYSAYGTPTFLHSNFTPRSPNQSGYDWETLYAGYRYDKASGFYQVRWRYLNSTLGTWLTRDPLGYEDSMNATEYVASRVTGSIDALGLAVVESRVGIRWHISNPNWNSTKIFEWTGGRNSAQFTLSADSTDGKMFVGPPRLKDSITTRVFWSSSILKSLGPTFYRKKDPAQGTCCIDCYTYEVTVEWQTGASTITGRLPPWAAGIFIETMNTAIGLSICADGKATQSFNNTATNAAYTWRMF